MSVLRIAIVALLAFLVLAVPAAAQFPPAPVNFGWGVGGTVYPSFSGCGHGSLFPFGLFGPCGAFPGIPCGVPGPAGFGSCGSEFLAWL
jgi:hypothetical protein